MFPLPPDTAAHRLVEPVVGTASAPDGTALIHAAQSIRREIARTSSERDRAAALPSEPLALILSSGLGAARVPRLYGGSGASFRDLAEIIIHLAAGDASVGQLVQPHFIFLERVRLMGSEAQRQRYLAAAAAGAFFGNAMSETGGTRGQWATRLTAATDGYRLNGRKFYATGTLLAQYTFVGALTPDDRRVLAVVPTDRAGVRLENDWDGFGQRATVSGSVVLDDVALAPDEVIDLAPWERRRHHTGAGSQIIHCAIDAGIAAAALDDAVGHGRGGARATRDSGVEWAREDTTVQDAVGDIAARAFAAEASVLHAADILDRASEALYAAGADRAPEVEPLLVEASLAVAKAKIISTQAALRAAERLFDVGGASGTARKHNFDRHWRNARTHTTHDPLAYKFRIVGDHLLNDCNPPNTFTY
jgi:alkylation response protein AidB-like acyl-CoA dehydrogenase